MLAYINNFDISDNSVMVVPFPVSRNNKLPICMVGLTDMPGFVNFLKLFEYYRQSNSFGFKNSSDGLYSRESFQVYEIGNYNISVAHDIKVDDLESRIDWSKFSKPFDFNTRCNTLRDQHIYYPNYDWVYVIAQATKSVKDDGFCIVYPNCGADYFPIAHEYRDNTNNIYDIGFFTQKYNKINNNNNNNDNNNVNYNVQLYHFTDTDSTNVKIGPLNSVAYVTTDKTAIDKLIRTCNNKLIQGNNNVKYKLIIDTNKIKSCNFYKLDDNGQNRNIYLKT